MSVRDRTQIPITGPRDHYPIDAGDHALMTRDATFATYARQLKLMIRSGVKLSEIERHADRAPVCDDEKAALWLYAWSTTHDSQ